MTLSYSRVGFTTLNTMIDITQIEEELVQLHSQAHKRDFKYPTMDLFSTTDEYAKNKRRFMELKQLGEIDDNMWYLIKDGQIFAQHFEKERILDIKRKHIVESRDWYFQHGSGPEVIFINLQPETHSAMELL